MRTRTRRTETDPDNGDQLFSRGSKVRHVDHENGQDLIDESLKALAEEFADDFVRIHRSALVAVRYVDRLEKTPDGKTALFFAITRKSKTKS